MLSVYRCILNHSCRAPCRLIADYLAEEEGAWREKPVCRVYLIARLFHRKAVKATLVLLPLLGITYMLFFVNPGEDEISQIVFIYFNSFLESFQVWSSCPVGCACHVGVFVDAVTSLRSSPEMIE